MPTPRRADAFMIPHDWPKLARRDDRPVAIRAEFQEALGGLAHYCLVNDQGRDFVRVRPEQKFYYQYGHPFQGDQQYEWFVAEKQGGVWTPVAPIIGHPGEADKVWIGYLKPDPHADSPEVKAAIVAAFEQRKAELLTSPEWQAHLIRLGHVEPTETTNPALASVPEGTDV